MSDFEIDKQTAIVSLNAGGGGEDACEFVETLYKMLHKYCASVGFVLTVTDRQDGAVRGIKSVEFTVIGNNAYEYLRVLKGVHRMIDWGTKGAKSLKRITLAAVDVIPMLAAAQSGFEPSEIKVDTFRSSGAGGQHVNKTESAVRLTHVETGVTVVCMQERSQMQNKEIATRILKSKLAKLNEDRRATAVSELQGDVRQIVLGSQIITYMYCPKALVKDNRSGYESSEVEKVLSGKLQPLIDHYLCKFH